MKKVNGCKVRLAIYGNQIIHCNERAVHGDVCCLHAGHTPDPEYEKYESLRKEKKEPQKAS